MPGAGSRRTRHSPDIWPGFVDALATLLMVVIFLLMIFVLAQFVLSHALSGRDQALQRIQSELTELTDLLGLERKANADLRLNVAVMSEELQASVRSRDDLSEKLRQLNLTNAGLKAENERLNADMDSAFTSLQEDRQKLSQLEKETLRNAAALAKAKAELEEANKSITVKTETLQLKLQELADLNGQLAALQALKKELEEKLLASDSSLANEKELSATARAQAALLNQQLQAVRDQMAALNEALEAAEKKNTEQNVQIADLGSRLNAALATKVQELARYRSEFFGRLRDILGDQKDVRIVGDRFVLQSEVLFGTGSAELGDGGKEKLAELAATLRTIVPRIPEDLDWILRVDGHTDRTPINNWRYPSNWELSTARAISVVRFLIAEGLPADHLAATGFADRHPLDTGEGDEVLRRNRRIEFKLTQR
ncbi:peptidoglycan -binding protein [Magnetospira thiophila]